jgi:hypothetical protein
MLSLSDKCLKLSYQRVAKFLITDVESFFVLNGRSVYDLPQYKISYA